MASLTAGQLQLLKKGVAMVGCVLVRSLTSIIKSIKGHSLLLGITDSPLVTIHSSR
jgi:hypothetical protein